MACDKPTGHTTRTFQRDGATVREVRCLACGESTETTLTATVVAPEPKESNVQTRLCPYARQHCRLSSGCVMYPEPPAFDSYHQARDIILRKIASTALACPERGDVVHAAAYSSGGLRDRAMLRCDHCNGGLRRPHIAESERNANKLPLTCRKCHCVYQPAPDYRRVSIGKLASCKETSHAARTLEPATR